MLNLYEIIGQNCRSGKTNTINFILLGMGKSPGALNVVIYLFWNIQDDTQTSQIFMFSIGHRQTLSLTSQECTTAYFFLSIMHTLQSPPHQFLKSIVSPG